MQGADGRLLAFNKSAERILGLSVDQLAVGSPCQPQVRLVHEDRSPFEAFMALDRDELVDAA